MDAEWTEFNDAVKDLWSVWRAGNPAGVLVGRYFWAEGTACVKEPARYGPAAKDTGRGSMNRQWGVMDRETGSRGTWEAGHRAR